MNNFVVEGFFNTIQEVVSESYKISEKTELTEKELLMLIKENLIINEKTKTKTKTKTKSKISKTISDEKRCIALKKDGDRCKGQKYDKGLCNLHIRSGAKYGTFKEEVDYINSINSDIDDQFTE
jgi:Fe-S-cluster containining protein